VNTPPLAAWPVTGIGEVTAGDDLVALLVDGLRASRLQLRDGDVLAVSSKVVSKAMGLAVPGDSRDDAVLGQTVRVVAERVTPRGVTRIVESRSGPVLAAAGVDTSNVAPGTVLVLPPDPDAAARLLRAGLAERSGRRLGVVVTDTMGRPWRDGQVDAALGAAGLTVTDDLRGRVDGYGNPLEVTVRALADEVAALADLVKGKLDGHPAALVRGLAHLVTEDDGPGPRPYCGRPGPTGSAGATSRRCGRRSACRRGPPASRWCRSHRAALPNSCGGRWRSPWRRRTCRPSSSPSTSTRGRPRAPRCRCPRTPRASWPPARSRSGSPRSPRPRV
jgi:coenzyme F420-0:L-glutamate ligase/coenzyme F420-1:gamma-L-glutamate ligase